MSKYFEPQDGPQSALLACPASEIFFGGARGGGKTFGVLLYFLAFWQRHGKHVQGAIFRRSYPELEGIIDYSLALFPQFGAEYSYTKKRWTFPDGAWVILRHLDTKKDASRHQGKEYSIIIVDEIGAWADFSPLWMLKACLRNTHGIPSKLIMTGNPGGPGQAAIKERYIDSGEPYELIADDDDPTWKRTYIPSRVADNKILMANDPQYVNRLKQVGADWLVKAWLEGDFNAAPDTFLGGIWDDNRHICEPFDIPEHWKRFRSLDWGFASPFSVLWYAIDTHGKAWLYRELYGQGKGRTEGTREDAGTVAAQILDIEERERAAGIKFMNNPADTSIWMDDGRHKSIFDIFLESGVMWSKASKGAGSRVNGAQEIIFRLVNDEFAVFKTCKHFLKHVPVIPTDDKNWEDVATDSLDHDWDCFSVDTELLADGNMVWTPKGWAPAYGSNKVKVNSEVIRLHFNDNTSMVCTPDHKFYTSKGWMEARDLKGITLPLSHPPSKSPGEYATTFAKITSKLPSLPETAAYHSCIKPFGSAIASTALEVVRITPETRTDVTCVSVPNGAHFTLANGVVVSNSLRYGLMSRQPKSRKPKKSKIIEGSFDWVAPKIEQPKSNYFGREA